MLADAIDHFGFILPVPAWFCGWEGDEEDTEEEDEGGDCNDWTVPPEKVPGQETRLGLLHCWGRNIFCKDILTSVGVNISTTGE